MINYHLKCLENLHMKPEFEELQEFQSTNVGLKDFDKLET